MAEDDVTTERIVLGIGVTVENGLPWYRVEAVEDADGDLSLDVTAGGGIEKTETIAAFSILLVAQFTGVPASELLGLVNAYRRAASLPKLEDVAFEG